MPETARRHARHLELLLVETLKHVVLADHAGVRVTHASLPPDELATWNAQTCTLAIRADAALEDQLWVLEQMLLMCAVGVGGTAARVRPTGLPEKRHLHSVPA